MEDAYMALYQEFLRLRSICQRQAAMLQHLTQCAALNTQPGATQLGPNGELDTQTSLPVPCTQTDLIQFYSGTHHPMAHHHLPLHRAASGNAAYRDDGVRTDLLTSGLDRLQLQDPQHQPLLAAPSGTCGPQHQSLLGGPSGTCAALEPMGVTGRQSSTTRPPEVFSPPKAPPSIIDDLKRAEQQWAEMNAARERRPWASSSFLESEWMSVSGGRAVSRVTLQSQVCEFCHAVFPGHTTTRGDFLRHLTSHIT
ncbi:uncharacterized protein zgc:113184 [Engraulis encrasicolus]|uniref:uncharacterized protein zgc:113184 n=1 Tax=Engraulis encrasicolus TaxID=184585 RepID=UPI002FCEB7A8